MLGEQLDAASAVYRVSYDDPSYGFFGAPPMRDIARLRETARISAGL